MKIIAYILISVFIVLSLVHFNWALGGSWGFDNSLPQTLDGEFLFRPHPIESAVVALGLLSFALFYFLQLRIISWGIPIKLARILGWVIPSIFLVRAIGDFGYVGFFKSTTGTDFAILDTIYYSPLCLGLSILGYLIGYRQANGRV